VTYAEVADERLRVEIEIMRRFADQRLNRRLKALGYRPSTRARRWPQTERHPGEVVPGQVLASLAGRLLARGSRDVSRRGPLVPLADLVAEEERGLEGVVCLGRASFHLLETADEAVEHGVDKLAPKRGIGSRRACVAKAHARAPCVDLVRPDRDLVGRTARTKLAVGERPLDRPGRAAGAAGGFVLGKPRRGFESCARAHLGDSARHANGPQRGKRAVCLERYMEVHRIYTTGPPPAQLAVETVEAVD
jgi:hypothetical protein